MKLLRPSADNLHLYVSALKRELAEGFETFHNSQEILEAAEKNPEELIANYNDLVGGRLITVDGGVERVALPSITRWAYDGEVCGTIQFRWTPSSVALPPYCMGHIGYQIFPWKRSMGYGKLQLELILQEIKGFDMPHVDLTTKLDNYASQNVIKANGGIFVNQFERATEYGGGEFNLYRIFLS